MRAGWTAMVFGAFILFFASAPDGTDMTETTVAIIGTVIFVVGLVCATFGERGRA